MGQIEIVYQDPSLQKAQGQSFTRESWANFQRLDYPNAPMFQNKEPGGNLPILLNTSLTWPYDLFPLPLPEHRFS